MLSIIAAHVYPQDDVQRFLASVREYGGSDVEVLLVAGVTLPAGVAGSDSGDSASVRVLVHPSRSIAELRGIGVTEAAGDVLAFVDPSCALTESWFDVVATEMCETPSLTGPVRYAGGVSPFTWAAFLSEYGAFLPPADAAAGVAGSNFVISRIQLEQVLAPGAAFDKPQIVEALAAAGVVPRFHPGLTVLHRRPWGPLGFLRDRYTLGRAYARGQAPGLSPEAVRLRARVAPGIGALLLWRLAGVIRRKQRYGWAFWLTAPVTLAFLTAWALGEGAGYWQAINMARTTA